MCAYIMDAMCFIFPFPIMGWKWTPQDPTPIHVYHKALWKYYFNENFYEICQGVMLHIYQAIFNKKAPRLSEEARADIQPVVRWFGEELLTYIRVFGSTLLHMYFCVPHKLLAREIAYQIVTKDVTKSLKESKKSIYPTFPLRCGVYCLNDFKHS